MAETRTNQPKREQDSSGASTTTPNRPDANRGATTPGGAGQKQTSGVQQPSSGTREGRPSGAGMPNPSQSHKPATDSADQDESCGCDSGEKKNAGDNGKNPTRGEE